MANISRFSLLSVLLLFAAWSFSGCYTQVGSERNDRDYSSREEYRVTDVDTTYNDSSGYTDNDYDYARQRFYYDSYYPGFTFGIGFGYYSPWYWRPYWGWGTWYYDPFIYNAWAWGPYPPIYEPGWWYPHYGSYYGSYYGLRYGRYNMTRTFGNSRMVGSTRGSYSGYNAGATRSGTNLPPAGTGRSLGKTSRPSTSTPSNLPPPRVSPGRRGDQRPASPSRDGSVNRAGRDRSARYSSPPRQEGRSGGARSSGSGRTYSPPSSPPSHSSPAPASRGGESRGGGGGSRSGGSRR